MSRVRPISGAALLAALIALGAAPSAIAAPIQSSGPAPSLPAFRGAAYQPHPLGNLATTSPQNPFMAPGSNSNIHNDTWMTGAYARRGPLGRSLRASSEAKPAAVCASLAFDSRGRIVSVCPTIFLPPQARIIDPGSLATIASYDLPNAPDLPSTRLFQNFTAGGYFFLDNSDRMWIPTKTDHIFVLGESADGRRLVPRRDYDLTDVLDPGTERITSALPDFSGRIWFATKQHGKVGTLDRKTGRARVIRLGEEIENSFAVARDGVYIVSDKRMYRFGLARNGAPRVIWKARYPNSGIVKQSQVNAGSGTTPTIMSGGYVAITDNADPMHVVVYRAAKDLRRGQHRVVCKVPVFRRGASATENSLIGSGRSLIVENNYGYQDPFGPDAGALTEPGFARVDIEPGGRGCRKVWTNRTVRGSTVVPKLSNRTGLVYTYSRDRDRSGSEGYYWTAIDFRTGRTVWQRYAGSGLPFNNNYAGLALGRNGAAYLGVIGGILKLRDGS